MHRQTDNLWQTPQQDKQPMETTVQQTAAYPSPYPTLAIPKVREGYITHAFCVVDNIIFDATLPNALPLTSESISTLFDSLEWSVHIAYHFNEVHREPGNPPVEKLVRTVQLQPFPAPDTNNP